MNKEIDEFWMRVALDLANDAAQIGEVPVGAIVVHEDLIVGKGFNTKETQTRATGHAEMTAIEGACERLGRWRLTNCTLYVTLEPCLMCVGAIIQSRVDRVVYGTPDDKAGAIDSVYRIFEDDKLNHRPAVTSGILRSECSGRLSNFFAELRQKKTGKLYLIAGP